MNLKNIHQTRDLFQTIREVLFPVYEMEADSLVSVLLENCCNLTRTDVVLNTPVSLNHEANQILENAISRLLNHEPIQYISGKTFFLGREFHVTPDVLIPRPETEELVYLIKKLNPFLHPSILDIGSGSGCIAISLAIEIPDAFVTAWDNSKKALKIAEQNAERYNLSISFECIDIFGNTPADTYFDIIVSNPPYVLESEKSTMRKNVLDFEPAGALYVNDSDPLIYYRRILQRAESILAPEGMVFFEVNEQMADEIAELLNFRDYSSHIKKDIHNKNRFVYGIKIST